MQYLHICTIMYENNDNSLGERRSITVIEYIYSYLLFNKLKLT